MTGCETCDQHGPHLPGLAGADGVELHRAAHDLRRAVVAETSPLVVRITDELVRLNDDLVRVRTERRILRRWRRG